MRTWLIETSRQMDERYEAGFYLTPGLDWTRLFLSLTAGAGTRCMSLLPTSPHLLSTQHQTFSSTANRNLILLVILFCYGIVCNSKYKTLRKKKICLVAASNSFSC